MFKNKQFTFAYNLKSYFVKKCFFVIFCKKQLLNR